MSQENVEIVRAALDAFNKGDVEGSVANLAPEFEYVPTGSIPGSEETYRGSEGWKQYLGLFWGEFDGVRIDIHDVIAAGDQVVVSHTIRGRGKQSGIEAAWPIWQVWTLRDGKGIRGQGFTTESEALEAAGIAE
jgi:ketosteroid isomerase-like protein